MKRLISLLILLPIGIVVIALAVANRQLVPITVPALGDQVLFAADVPLFMIVFVTLLIGMLIGSTATWFKQGKHRKEAREQKVEATKMSFEADKQKARAEDLTETMSSEQKALTALGLPAPSKAA